jgi:1,4-dihydroxy-6-naphthoate synthase
MRINKAAPRPVGDSASGLDRTIRVCHSPDSDDAFMFYALAEGKVDTQGITYVHELQDIETLNQRALRGELDVTAVSIHAYAYLADRYALLPHGASMGDRYGPRLVASRPTSRQEVRGKRVAIPGLLTSAYLALRLFEPDFEAIPTPFDEVEDAVANGQADFGLIIHEGQLTYRDKGLHLVLDLGEWWFEVTGLPLPLGGNVIKKSLGPDLIQSISRHLRDSIEYSLNHRQTALNHAMKFARGLDRGKAETFVAMYVNDWTRSYGPRGREAIRVFLDRGAEAGIIPKAVTVEFAED